MISSMRMDDLFLNHRHVAEEITLVAFKKRPWSARQAADDCRSKVVGASSSKSLVRQEKSH